MTRLLAVAVLLLAVAAGVLAFTRGDSGTVALAEAGDPAVDPSTDELEAVDADAAEPGTGELEAEASSASTAPPEPTEPAIEIVNEGPAMSLEDLDGWLQTDMTSLEDTRGKVTVVQFWTFDCFNCRNTLANMADLYARHGAGSGDLEIVGVHSPEFDYERDPDAISAAAVDLNVTWPIALDTEKQNFHDWQPGNRGFWPRTYVLDRDGNIRFDHIGEGAYDELNETVAALIADPAL